MVFAIGVCGTRLWGEVEFAFGVLGRGGRRDVVNYYQGSGVGWGVGGMWALEHDGTFYPCKC